MDKYTLDRFEGGFGVLLKHPEETERLLIPEGELNEFAKEGDILSVEQHDRGYSIVLLKEETEEMKSKVETLLKKLKNK